MPQTGLMVVTPTVPEPRWPDGCVAALREAGAQERNIPKPHASPPSAAPVAPPPATPAFRLWVRGPPQPEATHHPGLGYSSALLTTPMSAVRTLSRELCRQRPRSVNYSVVFVVNHIDTRLLRCSCHRTPRGGAMRSCGSIASVGRWWWPGRLRLCKGSECCLRYEARAAHGHRTRHATVLRITRARSARATCQHLGS
jgi:hypothetical protein